MNRRAASRIALAAAGFALAELAAGLTIGQFIGRDRAEVAIFLAFRPWLLVALAIVMPARGRAACYVLALLAASGGEALMVVLMGGADVAEDAARAIAAGLLLAALLEAAFLVARRAEPRFSTLLGALLAIGLLLVPGPLRAFEWIALRPPPPSVTGPRPAVTLLSGLPLLWGEGAPLAGKPNAAARRLAAEFVLRPIDVATPISLAAAPVLLAAQPHPLAADEIDSLDAWVRGGGRALLLADADLRWPSAYPPGDPRRPPRTATLAPLLASWGITLTRTGRGIETLDLPGPRIGRRVVVDGSGKFRTDGGCRPFADGHAAACLIGRGRVLAIADADLLDDHLWVAPGRNGDGRLARGGDNAVLAAEWLDALAANPRDRAADSIAWRRRGSPAPAIVAGSLPGLLLAAFGLRLLARRIG